MSISPLINKLRLAAGQKTLILNAPDTFFTLLGEIGDEIETSLQPWEGFDFGLLFVHSIEELERFAPEVVRSVNCDGLLWFAYPKKSSGINTDINRDKGWNVLSEAGLRPVTQISIDEVWSALRFRPTTEVGK